MKVFAIQTTDGDFSVITNNPERLGKVLKDGILLIDLKDFTKSYDNEDIVSILADYDPKDFLNKFR